VVKLLVENGAQISQSGWAPIHYAAFEGRTEVLKYLLGKGADKNALGANGFTALMLAARGGHLESARVLLYEDADVGIRGPAGETALGIAKSRKNLELEALLKRAGAVD
jgi:ankyrin repeat protein